MKQISLESVALATGGKLVNGNAETLINGVTMDSRKVEKGNLFAAIKGERVDGHDFIDDVFTKGAAAVICEKLPENPKGACILVNNTVKALQDLAEYYRKSLSIKVVGITGSVGKTSTKEIVAATLSAKYKVLKTEGNYNNEIGLPLTVLSIGEEHEIAVLEMGISDFGEMRVLSKIARPDICVITNIGQSHLENLGSRDGIYKAKSEIFEYMNPKGFIFLNGDDDILCTKKDVNGIRPATFGLTPDCDVHPADIVPHGLKGTSLKVVTREETFPVNVKLFGKHMISNIMAAVSVGKSLSMTTAEIVKGLENASTIDGRLKLIPFGEGFIIDDCYNAAPSSVRAAIDTLSMAEGVKAAVLGDMFELGTDSDLMHREIGEYAAKSGIDKLICIGENSIHMYEGAKSVASGVKLKYFPTVAKFIEEMPLLFEKDDTILVKASHGMEFVKVVEALKNR